MERKARGECLPFPPSHGYGGPFLRALGVMLCVISAASHANVITSIAAGETINYVLAALGHVEIIATGLALEIR